MERKIYVSDERNFERNYWLECDEELLQTVINAKRISLLDTLSFTVNWQELILNVKDIHILQ